MPDSHLGDVYSIQQYVITFVSDLRQVGGTPFSTTNKTDHHDITVLVVEVAGVPGENH